MISKRLKRRENRFTLYHRKYDNDLCKTRTGPQFTYSSVLVKCTALVLGLAVLNTYYNFTSIKNPVRKFSLIKNVKL
jgi:hypothetical protein